VDYCLRVGKQPALQPYLLLQPSVLCLELSVLLLEKGDLKVEPLQVNEEGPELQVVLAFQLLEIMLGN